MLGGIIAYHFHSAVYWTVLGIYLKNLKAPILFFPGMCFWNLVQMKQAGNAANGYSHCLLESSSLVSCLETYKEVSGVHNIVFWGVCWLQYRSCLVTCEVLLKGNFFQVFLMAKAPTISSVKLPICFKKINFHCCRHKMIFMFSDDLLLNQNVYYFISIRSACHQ